MQADGASASLLSPNRDRNALMPTRRNLAGTLPGRYNDLQKQELIQSGLNILSSPSKSMAMRGPGMHLTGSPSAAAYTNMAAAQGQQNY